jgi:hypothetical protein
MEGNNSPDAPMWSYWQPNRHTTHRVDVWLVAAITVIFSLKPDDFLANFSVLAWCSFKCEIILLFVCLNITSVYHHTILIFIFGRISFFFLHYGGLGENYMNFSHTHVCVWNEREREKIKIVCNYGINLDDGSDEMIDSSIVDWELQANQWKKKCIKFFLCIWGSFHLITIIRSLLLDTADNAP